MTVYFHNNGAFSCSFAVRWNGGESNRTGPINGGDSAQIDLYPNNPPVGTSCWAIAYINGGPDHASGDNFGAGNSNVTYNISGSASNPSFSCEGCS
jgi:hypothetical protein